MQGVVPPQAVAFSRTLMSATANGRRLLRWIDSPTGRWVLRCVERCTIPGMVGHWNCRKRWIDDAWQQAQSEGFNTLIIAGSGFDTLSLRATRKANQHVHAIDLDHPNTLRARRSGIELLGGPGPTLIEHDLGEPGLQRALEGALPEDANTLIVIEGVLMYLDPARVTALLSEFASLPSKRLRLVFTFMELSQRGKPAFAPRSWLVDTWLSLVGEPFCSGMTPQSLREMLSMHGFTPREVERHPGHSLTQLKLPSGECAVVADHSRHLPKTPEPCLDEDHGNPA